MVQRAIILGALLVLGCSSDEGDGDGDDTGDVGGERDAARAMDAGSDASALGQTDAALGDAGSGPGSGDLRPSAFMLDGTAEAQDGDDRVQCRFFATIDQLVYDDDGGFTGFAIGEAFRTVVVGEGGSEFAPLIGGPAMLDVAADGTVELRWVGDQPDDALQFWKDLEVITGVREGAGYAGSWRCGPGLLDEPGFTDVDLTAEGSWTLEPL